MAVQKSRKTPSRRGMRRSHDHLSAGALSEELATGEVHRRHHVSAEGFYRGRQVVETAPEVDFEDDDEQQ
ncbi:MAG: 50S ribosomal protein L32 [Wenzhouxiangellaceae bacterium]|nr:50S ribosomal protein L32 [Wenzhouxiangellaceae bacterium]